MNTELLDDKATQTWFVYDTRTGEVVHVHQFIPATPGGRSSGREMEEMALKLAPAAWDRAYLAVLFHDEELVLRAEHEYRVDIGNRALVIDAAPREPTQR